VIACRVLLADDHSLVRAGFRALIKEMQGFEVVGEAEDGSDALRLIEELRPDIALLDISMPRLNGLEVAARASKDHPRTRLIILSMHAQEEYVHRALIAGAAGYLLKNADEGELEQALRAVARGQTWLSPAISRTVVDALARGEKLAQGPFEILSTRQREILQLIAEGRSSKEIAQQLNLSVKTVESHRTELMERLGIHGIAGLVRYAIRAGIVHPDS
jgi:DNA-binding NarL/FixJ family response regulator